MSSLCRTIGREAQREKGKLGHSDGPHKTRNGRYFLKIKLRRRKASKIARLARRQGR